MSNESNSLTVVEQQPRALQASGVFSAIDAFESAQRMAKALASSDIVPSKYKGNLSNCLVALEVANRTGQSPLAVMQSLDIVHGKPTWTAQYVIGAINTDTRFAQPLAFEMKGEGAKRTCFAWTVDRQGNRVEGPVISYEMAKAEGWVDRAGSKWKTMPDLMLRYRAATSFGKIYIPEKLLGMASEDEARDVTPPQEEKKSVNALNEKIKAKKAKAEPVEAPKETPKVEPVAQAEVIDAEVVDVSDDENEGFF